MSYVAPDVNAYMGTSVPDGQCVAYVKAAAGCPATPQWREGAKVKGADLAVGTAIATFQNGRYTNSPGGQSHAAIYLRQTAAGLVVHDQWVGSSGVQVVHERAIRFQGGATTPNNDGDAFSVIEHVTVMAGLEAARRAQAAAKA